MRRAGVRRVTVESVAFLLKNSIFPPAYLLGRLLFPRTVADASAMERIFANTDLDWTMVRAPELIDKPYTGNYRVREDHLPRFGLKVSRADVGRLHDQPCREWRAGPQGCQNCELNADGETHDSLFHHSVLAHRGCTGPVRQPELRDAVAICGELRI